MKIFKFYLFTLLILASTPVFAGKMMFGDSETIHKIQDINYKDIKGNPYYLGYKTTMKMFIAGVYLSDDGYVLGSKDDNKKYLPLDTEIISKFQVVGFLPKPMPTYKITLFEYALGYSLWILIFVLGMYYWIKSKVGKRQAIE